MTRLLIFLAVGALVARAHDPGLSALTVDYSSRDFLVQVSFAPADLLALQSSPPADLATHSIELQTATGPQRATSVETRAVGADNVEFTLRFARPANGPVTVRSPLLGQLPFGHRQALTVRDSEGATVLTDLLSAANNSALLPQLSAAPSPRRPGLTLMTVGLLVIGSFGWFVRQSRPVRAAPRLD